MAARSDQPLTTQSGSALAETNDPVPTMKEVLGRYAPYLAQCRLAICRDLAGAPMGSALSEYFGRGKMLRPLLLFAATAAVGGDPEFAVPAAQALELLHGASLIHDDIVDAAKVRRGRPSLHRLIGLGPAVVLGDFLILRSYNVLAQVPSSRTLEALAALSRCAEECCRGQAEEMVSAVEDEDTEDSYFSIIRRKTASPFVAAATVGGILGEGSSEDIEALADFALNLGMCFQIRDDEMDLAGDSASPRAGNPRQRTRATIPVIYLKKYASPAAFTSYCQRQEDGATRSELTALLRAEGILDRLKTIKLLHLHRALEAAERLRNADEMSAIASHSVYRNA